MGRTDKVFKSFKLDSVWLGCVKYFIAAVNDTRIELQLRVIKFEQKYDQQVPGICGPYGSTLLVCEVLGSGDVTLQHSI